MKSSSAVPALRIRLVQPAEVRPEGEFVLYWMHAFRRAAWNFSLDRAIEWAKELRRPLLVVETLASSRRWDSDRQHRFVLQGMVDNGRAFERSGVGYYPLVESKAGPCHKALTALASRAAVIVTDDYPIREHSDEVDLVANSSPVRVETVDSNGLVPLATAATAYPTAYLFRRFLQRTVREYLLDAPRASPLARLRLPQAPQLGEAFQRRWPGATDELLLGTPAALRRLPIDHTVGPSPIHGGSEAAGQTLDRFLADRLPRYARERNHPDLDASSGLSTFLHSGHISVHQIVARLARAEAWSPDRLGDRADGKSEGFWGMSEAAESFLDELIVWRELSFNGTCRLPGYDRFDSLPGWAQKTLNRHARDPRPQVYSPAEFEAARTHDPLWNAAQTQLVREGRMHNYLRMLWGKKILQWTQSPEESLEVMIELNNKYALDGRDPNSYSGIFWVLGRYDRPWGPERPVFGTVRYMTSENTARKVRVKEYWREYGRGVES